MNIYGHEPGPGSLETWYIRFLLEGTYRDSDITMSFSLHWLRPLSEAKSMVRSQTSSALSLDSTIASWVSRCSSEHSKCNFVLPRKQPKPTRLLEIRKENEDLKVQLLERIGIPEECRYVALSYRWDADSTTLLSRTNIKDFKKDVPVSSLPKIFQDVFHVSIALGLSHVWIDSLCILQDSSDDWAREATTMAEAYQNAALNIAATACFGSNVGLTSEPHRKRPKVLIAATDVRLGDQRLQGSCRVVQDNFWAVHIDEAPLNQRGWVVQERFFSPRTLHFGKYQVLWQCQELQASEAFPEGPDQLMSKSNFVPYGAIAGSHRRDPIRQAWYAIVERYTSSALTISTDKLIAMTSMTKKFESLLNDKNVAGLWESTLITDLLWYIEDTDGNKKGRSYKDRAPTWSWASLDCGVKPILSLYPPPDCVATRIALTQQHQHPYWRGQLRLEAPLMKVQCSLPHSLDLVDISAKEATMQLRAFFDAPQQDFESIYQISHRGAVGRKNLWVHAFLISRSPLAGLFLKRTSQHGQYTRIGYFDGDYGRIGRYNNDDVAGFWKDGFDMAEVDYFENLGNGSYTFAIV